MFSPGAGARASGEVPPATANGDRHVRALLLLSELEAVGGMREGLAGSAGRKLLQRMRSFQKRFAEKFRGTTEGIVGLRGIIWVALVLFTRIKRRRVL